MKKPPICFAILCLFFPLMVMVTGCAGGPAETAETAAVEDKSAVTGIEWMLLEIRTPSKTIDLGRPKLEADGMGDVYSLRFDGETRAAGKGAPNRYTAPCSWGDDNALNIGTAAATLMAAFKEPEALKEKEFYAWLEQVRRWTLNQGRLELSTAPDKNGRSTVLVFVRKQ